MCRKVSLLVDGNDRSKVLDGRKGMQRPRMIEYVKKENSTQSERSASALGKQLYLGE